MATPPDFVLISPPERKRTYVYAPAKKGEDFVRTSFEQVSAVAVSPRGTHRLEYGDGKKAIVVPGWLHIELDMDKWTF